MTNEERVNRITECYHQISEWVEKHIDPQYFTDADKFVFEGGFAHITTINVMGEHKARIMVSLMGANEKPLIHLPVAAYDLEELVKILEAWKTLKARLLDHQKEEEYRATTVQRIIDNFEV